MLMRRVILGVFCCSFLFVATSNVFGQATGSLTGTVEDRTGAVVPGASVTATSQGTGIARETKTDDSGRFLLPLLPIGVYTLRVSAPSFQPVEQKDLYLQVDESREVNF